MEGVGIQRVDQVFPEHRPRKILCAKHWFRRWNPLAHLPLGSLRRRCAEGLWPGPMPILRSSVLQAEDVYGVEEANATAGVVSHLIHHYCPPGDGASSFASAASSG